MDLYSYVVVVKASGETISGKVQAVGEFHAVGKVIVYMEKRGLHRNEYIISDVSFYAEAIS